MSAIAGAGRRFNPAGWPSTVGAEGSLGRIGSPPLELSGGSGFHRFFFILIEPCGGLAGVLAATVREARIGALES
jgi:hypothetical protein